MTGALGCPRPLTLKNTYGIADIFQELRGLFWSEIVGAIPKTFYKIFGLPPREKQTKFGLFELQFICDLDLII